MVRPKVTPAFLIIVAFLVRLVLSPLVYHDDTKTNYWWGKFAVDFPLRGYYDWLEFGGYGDPNQPMLYIYFYKFIRLVYLQVYKVFWYLNTTFPIFPSKFMQWYFDFGNLFMEKFFVVLIEVFFIYLIYLFVKKNFNYRQGILALTILSIYPPFLYNTSLWGSNDIVNNSLGLLGIYFFYVNQPIIATLLFTLSLLFKSTLIIFIPVILVIILKNRTTVKSLLLSFFASLSTIAILSFPFSTSFLPAWFFNTYFQKIIGGGMPQLTSNAMNFWSILYTLTPVNDDIQIITHTNAHQLSLAFVSIMSIYIVFKLYKNYSIPNILLALTTISLISFCFLTRMHERYTFPAIIPLFLLTFYQPKYLKYFIILSLTHLLNVYRGWSFPPILFLQQSLEYRPIYSFIALANIYLSFKFVHATGIKEKNN